MRDVRAIVGSVTALDWEYLKRWAVVLGISDLLDEARA
jgi:hypothetical protein